MLETSNICPCSYLYLYIYLHLYLYYMNQGLYPYKPTCRLFGLCPYICFTNRRLDPNHYRVCVNDTSRWKISLYLYD